MAMSVMPWRSFSMARTAGSALTISSASTQSSMVTMGCTPSSCSNMGALDQGIFQPCLGGLQTLYHA